jgi:ATP-binding cassette subfamily C protein LapB
VLREAVIGGLMINVVALATSFYSMQVYDRVIPANAVQTLLVLTLGVLVAIVFELAAKRVRSRLYERLIDAVDQRLSRIIYLRFLAIRLDQLPQSVGGLAAQMRGYETVRGFFTAMTTNLLVDAPFALIFLLLIGLIGGWLALIPLLFFILCVVVGLYYRKQVDDFAGKSNAASNQKTGLLVETIEGAESIKSGQGGWRMLARWMKTTDEARDFDLQMRNISEHSQHLASALQQISYTLLIAAGAGLVFIAAQALILRGAFLVAPASPQVEALARDYLKDYYQVTVGDTSLSGSDTVTCPPGRWACRPAEAP